MGFINYRYLVVYGWKVKKYETIHVDYEVFETLEKAERWAEQFNFSEIFERIIFPKNGIEKNLKKKCHIFLWITKEKNINLFQT